MELWAFGAILALVGFLVIACGFENGEFGVFLPAAGVTSVGVGSAVFVNNFRKWIENL